MSRFGGFVVAEEPVCPIPRAFLIEVLPQIGDIAEVKVTLGVFDLAARGGGFASMIAVEELLRYEPLRAGLRRAGSPREPDESIERGLELAVSRGTLLRFRAEYQDGAASTWLLLHTAANRETLVKLARGVLAPPDPVRSRPGPPPAVEPERPNVFRLYEQNVGLLTPLIADQLIDALERYPAAWIEEAIEEAVHYNKRNWRYIAAILGKWAREGRGGNHAEHRGSTQGAGQFDAAKYRGWRAKT